jgi:hypothetical protein
VKQFIQQEFPKYYQMYAMVKDPATQMDNVDFPAGTRQLVDREMGITSGQEHFDWRAFEPMYNTIIMSKLILLDGDGLNELARRAGIAGPLFAPGEDTNVMLGVFKSMTHSYQWTGEVIPAETKYGICGPEDGKPLPPAAQCGINGRAPAAGTKAATLTTATATLGNIPGRGFVLYQHPDAKTKVFERIFKGFGEGPGTSVLDAVAEIAPAPAAVRAGARALSNASDQAEHIREIVAVMQGKIAGVARATTAPVTQPVRAPGRLQPAGRVTPATPTTPVEAINNWGQRCCAKDVASIRIALNQIRASSGRFQGDDVLTRLGRRPAATINGVIGSLTAALVAFENTRDAQSAGAALAVVAGHANTLAGVIAGTR